MKTILLAACLAAACGAAAAAADDAAVRRELVPTGKLRVAIAVSPSASALYVVKGTDGQFHGVSVDLGAAMAKKLGVPVEYVPYLASGEITNTATVGVWDVTFVPYDAERAKFIDFGAAYHVLQSTYLVAPGSTIKSIDQADRPEVRVAGVANTATYRAAQKATPKATFITVPGVDAAVALMKEGKADAIGLSRESLGGLASKIPGSRMLDGSFLNSFTAVAVPPNKPAARDYVTAFVEEAKASGLVRRALDSAGLTSATVAAAGAKP